MSNKETIHIVSVKEAIFAMSQGIPGALSVLMRMLEEQNGISDIRLLDTLGINGSKIWYLYNDSCDRNMDKFRRTLMAFRCGAYTDEEIQANLESGMTIPFLDDSVQIDGISPYDKDFGPKDPRWRKYIKANRDVVVPQIRQIIENQKPKDQHL